MFLEDRLYEAKDWKIKRVGKKTSTQARLINLDVDTYIYLGPTGNYFKKDNQPPWHIQHVEPIKLQSRDQRQKAIENAHYNTFLLKSKDVYLDYLTDSGTGSMSDNQWDGLERGDESYAGSPNFDNLENAVKEVMGYPFIVPTHQGRPAEHILCKVLVKPGQYIPNNMYFTTRRTHQELTGGIWKDFVVAEAYDPESEFPFKGNMNLEKLESFLKKHIYKEIKYSEISHISFEACLNMAGGQPFSMANLRELRFLSKKYEIPLWLDATRVFCNALYIQERESGYGLKSVKEITKEICSLTDGCTMSAKKDGVQNIGGFLATFDRQVFEKARALCPVYEGLHTYGGLAGRDVEATARGLLEFSKDEEVRFYVHQVRDFGEGLYKRGVPVVRPIGAHGVFLDAKRFYIGLPQEKFPAQILTAKIYEESGIRTMERGIVSGQHGSDSYDGLELVRVTIPRRVYTQYHFDYAIEAIEKVYKSEQKITGLKMTYSPENLRFFLAEFQKNPDLGN